MQRSQTSGLAFVASVLACWRVSHLIAFEDGPFDVVLKVRSRAGPGRWGRLMDCPYCLSIWVAAPLAGWTVQRTGLRSRDGVVVWLAISGGASLLERVTSGHEPVVTLAGPVDPPGVQVPASTERGV